jgi:small multidrug resistance pump
LIFVLNKKISSMLTLAQCWIILFACIAVEVTGSICLKFSNQYQYVLPSVMMFVCFGIAIAGFPYALMRIDLGTAYAVWSGVGTALTAAIGIVALHEKATWLKLIGVGIIIFGVILLNIAEADEEKSTQEIDDDMGDASETTVLLGNGSL